eukprot:TRINITY_DN494_c0_g2_i6.p1 TRINITY_DN494_c0_g2~~TRINITY_DN494_c0_g2_i6.p1  ORF type:complete len:258 (-),score=95.22 TRINITY_DN494_c0_g2_i6:8-781(-)
MAVALFGFLAVAVALASAQQPPVDCSSEGVYGGALAIPDSPADVDLGPFQLQNNFWLVFNYTSNEAGNCINFEAHVDAAENPDSKNWDAKIWVCNNKACPVTTCFANATSIAEFNNTVHDVTGHTPRNDAVGPGEAWLGVFADLGNIAGVQVNITVQQFKCGAHVSPLPEPSVEPSPSANPTKHPINTPSMVPIASVSFSPAPTKAAKITGNTAYSGVSKGIGAFLFFLGLGIGIAGWVSFSYYRERREMAETTLLR